MFRFSSKIYFKSYSSLNKKQFCTNLLLNNSINPFDINKLKFKENLAFKSLKDMPSITIVRDKPHAKRVIEILKSLKNRFVAWDTETLGIDPKEQSPVGNGQVICFSAFAGPDVDFGNGPRLFIDNYSECEGIVQEFKEYFEDPHYFKVWHNYGFDRHILGNHGINVK